MTPPTVQSVKNFCFGHGTPKYLIVCGACLKEIGTIGSKNPVPYYINCPHCGKTGQPYYAHKPIRMDKGQKRMMVLQMESMAYQVYKQAKEKQTP